MAQVFISYRRDQSMLLAALIKSELEKRQISAFLDVRDIHSAGLFTNILEAEIDAASALVCVIGPTTLDSPWVLAEVAYAYRHNKILIPVLQPQLDVPRSHPQESVNRLLMNNGVQWPNEGDYIDAAVEKLVRIIRTALPEVRRAETLATDPAKEKEYLEWLVVEMTRVGQQWYVPLKGYESEAQARKHRPGLFRHDPLDYLKNPALADSELAVRAGFGRRVKIQNLARELGKFTKVVVLGDPGAGKSVCLRQLAYDLAEKELLRRQSHPYKIPIFMDMGAYDEWANESARQPMLILNFMRQQLRNHESNRERPHHPLMYIADKLESLLEEGRVTCIFDALDEMPQDSYQERYAALKDFMRSWQDKRNRFIYSCRSLDYDPSFSVDEVIVDSFDRPRIKRFLDLRTPKNADVLYRKIIEDEAVEEMVSNPFFLQALVYINTERHTEPGNSEPHIPLTRSQLIRRFAEELMSREGERHKEYLAGIEGGVEALHRFLSELGFLLQLREHGGTSVETSSLEDLWSKYPGWQKLLWVARRARILGKRGEPPEEQAAVAPNLTPPQRIEFVHHRLQEYFAASELADRVTSGQESLKPYLENIWWQETVIIAIGLVSDAPAALRNVLALRADVDGWMSDVIHEAGKIPPPDVKATSTTAGNST